MQKPREHLRLLTFLRDRLNDIIVAINNIIDDIVFGLNGQQIVDGISYITNQHLRVRNTLDNITSNFSQTRSIAVRITDFLNSPRLNLYGYFSIFGAFNIINVNFYFSHFLDSVIRYVDNMVLFN